MPSLDLAQKMFHDVDVMNPEAFVGHLTEDVTFQFGNAPEAQGRGAVLDAVAGFFSLIDGLQHETLASWSGPDSLVVQQFVHYTRKDGRQVKLPCTNVLRYRGDLVRDYRIYMDVSPVFAAWSGPN